MPLVKSWCRGDSFAVENITRDLGEAEPTKTSGNYCFPIKKTYTRQVILFYLLLTILNSSRCTFTIRVRVRLSARFSVPTNEQRQRSNTVPPSRFGVRVAVSHRPFRLFLLPLARSHTTPRIPRRVLDLLLSCTRQLADMADLWMHFFVSWLLCPFAHPCMFVSWSYLPCRMRPSPATEHSALFAPHSYRTQST